MVKLQCPKCKSENTKVNSTRQRADRVTRYRECNDCKHRFRTIERIPSGWDPNAALDEIKKIANKF
jgi:transcriptional regulator NrdR family protein